MPQRSHAKESSAVSSIARSGCAATLDSGCVDHFAASSDLGTIIPGACQKVSLPHETNSAAVRSGSPPAVRTQDEVHPSCRVHDHVLVRHEVHQLDLFDAAGVERTVAGSTELWDRARFFEAEDLGSV